MSNVTQDNTNILKLAKRIQQLEEQVNSLILTNPQGYQTYASEDYVQSLTGVNFSTANAVTGTINCAAAGRTTLVNVSETGMLITLAVIRASGDGVSIGINLVWVVDGGAEQTLTVYANSINWSNTAIALSNLFAASGANKGAASGDLISFQLFVSYQSSLQVYVDVINTGAANVQVIAMRGAKS